MDTACPVSFSMSNSINSQDTHWVASDLSYAKFVIIYKRLRYSTDFTDAVALYDDHEFI